MKYEIVYEDDKSTIGICVLIESDNYHFRLAKKLIEFGCVELDKSCKMTRNFTKSSYKITTTEIQVQFFTHAEININDLRIVGKLCKAKLDGVIKKAETMNNITLAINSLEQDRKETNNKK